VSERKRHFSKKPSQNKKIFFENFLEAEKPAQETHKKRGQVFIFATKLKT